MPKSIEASEDLEPQVRSRRRFMAGAAGLTALGLLGASKLGAAVTGASDAAALSDPEIEELTQNDVNILNFALNLEYLEAEFALRAAFGRGLSNADITGRGDQGDVQGGSQVPFQNPLFRDFAREIALDEENHVQFLRAALGPDAVARPSIDLQQSFTAAARAAGIIGPNQQFDPFANEVNFLLGAFLFEDVGVTAYKGAARLLNDKGVLEAAAGILAVEAYHAGGIRLALASIGQYAATRAISDLRDAADGPGDRDQPIRLQGRVNIVPTDANGIAFSRTPNQVLRIVYLGGEQANFGFFPDRLNGAIR